jgi:uncharacterized protein
MKLHLTQAEDNNLITGYGNGFIDVNKVRYTRHLVIMPKQLMLEWSATDFASLTAGQFDELRTLSPEVVLLGTGDTHQFIRPQLIAKLTENNIAVECMTTDAACRTYNILMSEGRNVAAALLLSN